MSTFGEIIEPVSRAAWEDWDEIVPENNLQELRWQENIGTIEPIKTFIIFEGKYLSDIVTAQTRHDLEFVNCVGEVNLHLFKSRAMNKYVCIIKDYNLVQSSEIVQLLNPYLTVSENVIAIQTKPLTEFQSSEFFNQDCIMRTVSTTKTSLKSLDVNWPKLEQPNIITGVTAGAICLQEFLDRAGTAIVCYIEHPEEYQIEEVQKLLKTLDFTHNVKSKPNSVLNSNLYI